MSKPVRLPDYLHAEVEKLAKEERRSLANMVQVLLEQALKLPDRYIPPTVKVSPEMMAEIKAAPARPTEKPKRSYEAFSLVCPNRANHKPGVYCPECKGDGGR